MTCGAERSAGATRWRPGRPEPAPYKTTRGRVRGASAERWRASRVEWMRVGCAPREHCGGVRAYRIMWGRGTLNQRGRDDGIARMPQRSESRMFFRNRYALPPKSPQFDRTEDASQWGGAASLLRFLLSLGWRVRRTAPPALTRL